MGKKELKFKARMKDASAIAGNVRSIATYVGTGHVTDYFFETERFAPGGELMLQTSSDSKLVKLKVPVKIKKLQENEIYTFGVDRAEDFLGFLDILGIKPCCIIHKRSDIYSYEDITIELAEIKELGDFIELKLTSTEKEAKADSERLRLLALQIGIEMEDLDARYYYQILREGEEKGTIKK